jgi:putative ABC transport system substrate-binding protein
MSLMQPHIVCVTAFKICRQMINVALAAKAATTTIPIVFYIGVDPRPGGLVASFARPGGNLTGISSLNALLNSKRLGLLREIVPDIATVGLLINPANMNADTLSKEAIEAAHEIKIQMVILKAQNEKDLAKVFSQGSIDGVIVEADPFFNSLRKYIVDLVAKSSIPTIYADREFTLAGGLISYSYSLVSAWYQVGAYAKKILDGAQPADLPVQQPITLQLVINLQTAKALGITIPMTLLLQADEVIE